MNRSKTRFDCGERDSRKATTDARGDFAIANVPDGKFFVHVTPGPNDTEHLPGGDRSRRSYSAEQLRGQSMTIKVSSSPSAAARFTGSSACLACHKDKQHWQQTAHKLGWTVPDAPGRMQDFSRHPDYFDALESFPAGRRLRARNAPRAGRLRRGQGRRQIQAASIRRCPAADRHGVCRRLSVEERGATASTSSRW